MNWKAQEDIFLEENYYSFGKDYCAEHLNRTTNSIRMRVSRLGLRRPLGLSLKDSKWYEEQIFERNIMYTPLEPYVKSSVPIWHECINEHKWKARPNHILKGSGCPYCKSNAPLKVYFISCGDFYKIGVTSKEIVSDRFGTDWQKFSMKLIWETPFMPQILALKLEQQLLKSYKHISINTGLLYSGNTETLKEEIQCPI